MNTNIYYKNRPAFISDLTNFNEEEERRAIKEDRRTGANSIFDNRAKVRDFLRTPKESEVYYLRLYSLNS